MLYNEKIAVCSDSRAKHTDALSVQSVECLNVQPGKYKNVQVKLSLYTP
jgi:hypothetical protein